MKKEKGFTLIELLAVIVILAIIALIATPRIMAAIEQARKEAFRNDVYGIVKAVERDYVKRLLDEEKVEVTYEFEDYVQTVTPEHIDELAFTGKGPKNGTIIVDEEGNIDLALDNDNWCGKLSEDGEVTLEDINESSCEIDLVFTPAGGSWSFEVTTTEENERFAFAVADVLNPNLTVDWGDGNDTTLEGYDLDYNGLEEDVIEIFNDFLLVFSWWSDLSDDDSDLLDALFSFLYYKVNYEELYYKYQQINIYDLWNDSTFNQVYSDVPSGVIDVSAELSADPELNEFYNYIIEHIPISEEIRKGIVVENVYSEPGTYEVIVDGSVSHLSFCSIDHTFWYSWDCEETTPHLLTNILTPIPLELGLTSAHSMFTYTNIGESEIVASDFFDEAIKNVTTIAYMFAETPYFNIDINHWDITNVIDISAAFIAAQSFDQNLNNWDTSNVVGMEWTFSNTNFNQPIVDWNTSNVISMRGLFRSSPFNQDISGWDVSNVEVMNQMFDGNSSFNQDIGGWNTSSILYVGSMFRNATSFNQDLSGWCVSNISSPPFGFSTSSGLSSENHPNWGTCP